MPRKLRVSSVTSGHPLCDDDPLMKLRTQIAGGAFALLLLAATPVFAQTPSQPAPPETQPPAAQPKPEDPDKRVDPLQPDFTLAALPTTLRMPKNRSSFRVTHRFSRNLGAGDFGDLLNDFFGFDSGAQIGLEFRYGLLPGTQVGVYRTSNRDIQIFGQQSILQQKPDGHAINFDVIATFEGANNMKDAKSSAIGAIVSRKVGKFAALYVEPMFVANSNTVDSASDPDNNTTMIGFGGRVRIRPTTYLVGEYTPRVSGYRPGPDQVSFGIEMRAGGHLFQINFSNGRGTTLRQIAQGAVSNDQWFIGFNISRKFF